MSQLLHVAHYLTDQLLEGRAKLNFTNLCTGCYASVARMEPTTILAGEEGNHCDNFLLPHRPPHFVLKVPQPPRAGFGGFERLLEVGKGEKIHGMDSILCIKKPLL